MSWEHAFMSYRRFGFWTIYAEDQATVLGTYWLYRRAKRKLMQYASTL